MPAGHGILLECPSNCSISSSVQLWWPSVLTLMALTSRVGSSSRKPSSTACLIMIRSAIRSALAVAGRSAWAAIILTICSRRRSAARLLPCSRQSRSMVHR
jgi:hypothetical protein